MITCLFLQDTFIGKQTFRRPAHLSNVTQIPSPRCPTPLLNAHTFSLLSIFFFFISSVVFLSQRSGTFPINVCFQNVGSQLFFQSQLTLRTKYLYKSARHFGNNSKMEYNLGISLIIIIIIKETLKNKTKKNISYESST